jgi:hypothetical protein
MICFGAATRSTLAVLAVALAVAAPAAATSTPNSVYTLDASVAFSIIGASGTIEAYDLSEGFLGGLYESDTVCLDGACSDPNDYSSQDWLLVRVSVTSGTLDEVSIGSLFNASTGLGYFTSLGGSSPTSGDSTTNPNTPAFSFASLSGSSAPIFAVYSAGALPSGGGPFGTGATNFTVRLGGSSNQVQGHATTLIPEPATGFLLGFGLVALSAARRRR